MISFPFGNIEFRKVIGFNFIFRLKVADLWLICIFSLLVMNLKLLLKILLNLISWTNRKNQLDGSKFMDQKIVLCIMDMWANLQQNYN